MTQKRRRDDSRRGREEVRAHTEKEVGFGGGGSRITVERKKTRNKGEGRSPVFELIREFYESEGWKANNLFAKWGGYQGIMLTRCSEKSIALSPPNADTALPLETHCSPASLSPPDAIDTRGAN